MIERRVKREEEIKEWKGEDERREMRRMLVPIQAWLYLHCCQGDHCGTV